MKYKSSVMRIVLILGVSFLFFSSNVFYYKPVFAYTQDSHVADVIEKCINSVVNISSTKVIREKEAQHLAPFFEDPFFSRFFGPRFFNGIPRERREKSLGSGVIVSHDGIVLTNNHVIENAEEIIVTLADEREFKAEIVGSDPKSDVAVIKLKGKIHDLQPIHFGNSNKMRLGDEVLAIGNPFGLSHTVTMGIVSAKGRANVGIADYEDFIQTDAAINPGNSGGALINLQGELVGINTAIVSRSGGYQGIGFAIPSNMAKLVMESLVKYGKVVRGWLGVVVQEVNKDLADAMELNSQKGILVSQVIEDSPAEKNGIKHGDIILKINGKEVDSISHFRNTIAILGADSEVHLTILRDGKEKTYTITLTELSEDLVKKGALETENGVLGGMTIVPLTPAVREKFEIPSKIQDGLVITEIKQESPAQRSGLQPGDLILEINRKKVSTVDGFRKEYKKSTNSILLLIHRQGMTLYLVLKK
ncbi:MAG: DegQ family serine endoprotease [bacterium]